MLCPICSKDLTPLDLQSRTEHVEVCIEYGPEASVETNERGQVVITTQVVESKRRKICPVCNKTFKNIETHFKVCVLKNDVPIYLILEYWDKLNEDQNKNKKFPEDLLKSFVIKSMQEDRVGEQVELAKTMYFSLTGKQLDMKSLIAPVFQQAKSSKPRKNVSANTTVEDGTQPEPTLIQAPQSSCHAFTAVKLPPSLDKDSRTNKKRFPLEYVNNFTKQSNIKLRIERELAASRSFQYSISQMNQPNPIDLMETEVDKQPIQPVTVDLTDDRDTEEATDQQQSCTPQDTNHVEESLDQQEFMQELVGEVK